MKKTAAIIFVFIIIVAIQLYPATSAFNTVVEAQSSTSSVAMPVEYVNYTISKINGTLWATVDGTYPMQIPQSSVGHELPMFYPTPPGVTNISLKLNEQAVNFSNLTQSNPDALHYTYLGYWSMIIFIIQPASTNFLLTIHYQHPIVWADGTDMFLYDLNISPYLSNQSSQSVAHFNIFFQTNCSNINVYTVPGDSSIQRSKTKTPLNYTLNSDKGIQTVTFNITSNYFEPIPGDELITFQNTQTQIPELPTLAVPFSIATISAFTGLLVVFRKRKQPKPNDLGVYEITKNNRSVTIDQKNLYLLYQKS